MKLTINEQFGDARIEELKLLSEIDRQGRLTEARLDGPRRDLVAFLIQQRFVNDLQVDWAHNESDTFSGLPGESTLERKLNQERLMPLSRVLGGQSVDLQLTHRGRVRLSELKQALRSGRDREPFGILIDNRHLDQDLQIAITEVGEKTQLSLGYLDMNGLKRINDEIGHAAGDVALKAYFRSVAEAMGDRGEAYRGGGGDEVVTILPRHSAETARSMLRRACRALMKEDLKFSEPRLERLSISVGISTTVDAGMAADELKHLSDGAMRRAKKRTRDLGRSVSAIAVDGIEAIEVIEP